MAILINKHKHRIGMCITAVAMLLHGLPTFAQKKDTIVFTDFDWVNLKPIKPTPESRFGPWERFIRVTDSSAGKLKMEIEERRETDSKIRKINLVNTRFGTVLAFSSLRTTGYEKVLIFADHDIIKDSLLIRNDTLIFKEMADDWVDLSVVYPAGTDTLVVRTGYRNTRHDFLEKIYYNPALKNYHRWFLQNMLDRDIAYVLVKSGNGYRVAEYKADPEKMSDYDKQQLPNRFLNVGPSPFWVALEQLAIY